MHSNFSAAGRSALDRLTVPLLQMDTIRTGARIALRRDRVRGIVVCAALAIGAVGAVGLGERLYDGVHVWLSGSKAAVEVQSLTMIDNPNAKELRSAVSSATFHVILPVGLPDGIRVTRLFYAPAHRPNTLDLNYLNQRTGAHFGVTLVDSTVVDAERSSGTASLPFRNVHRWNVGDEIVIIPKDAISEGEAGRIRAAMASTNASNSLTATESMLSRMTVLGKSYAGVPAAEALAAGAGGVLLPARSLHSIANLAAHHEPLPDSRTVVLSDIPSRNGEPDYSKATLDWPNTIAVSANGVRAISAVLRSTNWSANRGELLFTQPNASTYWIWEIPIAASAPAKKYAVNAETLTVKSL